MKDKRQQNKFEPPVAGTITWTRFLFRRLKNTIVSFRKVPEMRESEHIKAVSHFISLFYYKVECNFGALCSGHGQVRGNGAEAKRL